jgi:hypothetical protein
MNDNTILRIKVPAHLYESVKEQLTINEAKKSGKAFGDWKVVKEKKLPKDGMKKVEEVVEETIEETNETMEKKVRTLDELKAAKSKLEKKIEEMESSDKKLDEYDPKMQGAMDVLSSIPGIDKLAEVDPFTAGMALVGMVVGGIIAAPKIGKGIKAIMDKIKDPKKKAELAAAAKKGGVNEVDGGVM